MLTDTIKLDCPIVLNVYVRNYNHPIKGNVWATIVANRVVSVIGQNGPVTFDFYGTLLCIDNQVTNINEDNFIPRIP